MNTRGIEDDFGDPDRSARAGWLATFAHSIPYALAIMIAFRSLRWFDIIGYSWWSMAIEFVFVVPLLSFSLHQSLARLCLKCMQEVPDDAPVRVQRWRWLLKLFHLQSGWKFLLIMLAILVVEWPVRWALDAQPGQHGWTHILWDLFIVGMWWSMWKHHRYRPWCPYCRRWDDGGDHEHVPTPDPTGAKTA